MASLNKSHLFKALQLEILEEIKTEKKIKKKYRHSCGKRTSNIIITTCCSLTCCLPCIVWDTFCSCLSCFCKSNPVRYGAGYMFIDKMCSSTFEDLSISIT